MLGWVEAFLKGEKSLHLKFLNFNNSGEQIKTKTKTSTTTTNQTQSAVTNNYNGPTTIVQIIGSLDDATRRQLQPLLDSYEKKEALFIADEPKKLLSDVSAHEADSLVWGLIKFFKPRISVRDFQLMRTGLYLKYLRESDRKDEAIKLWKQGDNYSAREKTVLNLASAGYFHTYFRPLYKQLMKGPNPEKKFKNEYESILGDVTFAIFVHSNMTTQEIVDKVTQKAIKNIRYGVKIKTISLHATGIISISKVREAVVLLKPVFPSITIKTLSKGLEIVTANIDYHKNNLDANFRGSESLL